MGLLDIKPNKVKADLLDYKIAIYGQAKSGKTTLVYDLVDKKYDGD